MSLYFSIFPSPCGDLRLVVDDAGAVTQINFPLDRRPEHLRKPPRRPEPPMMEDRARTAEVARQLGEYFAGRRQQFELVLRPAGSDFQQAVWRVLSTIPYGETRSYLQVAEAIGHLEAVRAVGAANGANPIPIVVPCHRVIGSNGSLTGFGGGLPNKRLLLALEGALVEPASPPDSPQLSLFLDTDR